MSKLLANPQNGHKYVPITKGLKVDELMTTPAHFS